MPAELVGKKARNELREYFVGTTLRTIEMAFGGADIYCDLGYEPGVGGQRRTLVEQYYYTLDFTQWRDLRKFLAVYEAVLQELSDHVEDGTDWDRGESAKHNLKVLRRCIERDGFRCENGKVVPLRNMRELESLKDAAGKLDAPELHRQIDRIRDAVEDDPRLAIGSAKELIETTCKTILEQRGIEVDRKWDLPQLLRKTRDVLGLLPEQVDEQVKGAKAVRKILQGLGAACQGLAELRNLYGTGHGAKAKPRGLGPRHARLAAGSAATLAGFLLETHEERESPQQQTP